MRDDARFASRVERLYKESGQVGARRTDDGGWGTDGLAWPADHAGCDLEELHVRDWGGRRAAVHGVAAQGETEAERQTFQSRRWHAHKPVTAVGRLAILANRVEWGGLFLVNVKRTAWRRPSCALAGGGPDRGGLRAGLCARHVARQDRAAQTKPPAHTVSRRVQRSAIPARVKTKSCCVPGGGRALSHGVSVGGCWRV